MLGYTLYWDDSGFMLPRVTLSNPSLTFYSETSVVQGKVYNFKISAINSLGEGPLSSALTVIPAATPNSPQGLTVVVADSTHIQLNWVEPYDGGSEISLYKIYWD